MAWAPLLLTLLTYCSGSLSQYTLTQPPTVSVSIGNTVKLSCTLSSGYTFGDVVWYQQKTGNIPRYLLRYNTESNKHQGSGVPNRFAGSKDASNTIGYLTITSIQTEDEADYYCATGTAQVSSQLVVTQEPSISVTPGGIVTLSCSLSTGAITSSKYPSWFQQKPGSAPRLLIYTTNTRPSGIPARFSGSISSNNAVLTITDVQAEDEADYYCLIYTGSSGSWSHTSTMHVALSLYWLGRLIASSSYAQPSPNFSL
ncbi:immunoglobulin lambda-1 light chain-like [Gopherus evgoodei]|uniref:immunoglobulin lambda-1 light chain-like n=1 Tax=Gopherus evgoodei TaxID=1825980 RepID=UPI0011CF3DFA|nr:immunoglobulin lambda-1 light chain-like [Gopherus evgoodei]